MLANINYSNYSAQLQNIQTELMELVEKHRVCVQPYGEKVDDDNQYDYNEDCEENKQEHITYKIDT